MRKIPSLFERERIKGQHPVRNEVTVGCEWVIQGEGIATRKFDGTCCLIENGKLFNRYDAKHGKTPPVGFIPAQVLPDVNTGHWPGWLEVLMNDPDSKYHLEAFKSNLSDGTYELCGPKIQSNPEKYTEHVLIPHGIEIFNDCPRTYIELYDYLMTKDVEGIVWHHQDGRKAKIKTSDFGLKRVGC